MSDTSTHTTETTEERKPPTLADIVREKTDDGKRIIDFFLDVMEDRIEGAELCHRIDAAKQLEKHKSKAAARFLAEYRGVKCGHSINGRPNPADPCTAEDRSLVAVTLNAPPTLTQDFLTVLSGIDEFLMARLIRAQTADAGTIIDFLDDVMQDRNDGFKTHHRIAAAKELIVHIVRDEQPAPTPSPSTGEGGASPESPRRACPVLDTGSESDSLNSERRTSLIPPLPQGEGWGEGASSVVPAQTEGNPDNSTVIPAKSLPRTRYGAGIQRSGGPGAARPSKAGIHPEPSSSVVPAPTAVVPAKSLPRTRYGAGTHPRTVAMGEPAPEHLEAGTRPRPSQANREPAEGRQLETKNSKLKTLPARVELTIAERRIKERLEQHWHEPDPYGAPIDSTHPGRSPPW